MEIEADVYAGWVVLRESLPEGLHDGLTGVTAVDDDMDPMRAVHAAIQDFELSEVHAFVVPVERFHGGWITKELRPAEDPNGFDLFWIVAEYQSKRGKMKSWDSCVFCGVGWFLPPVLQGGGVRASGGRFARLHVFGVATGPLRMCVVVCMHEHHL